ncbi:MAG: YncE family protein [Stellaceae bacterium]
MFVAELGNDSVGVLDMRSQAVVHRMTGLSKPQGVGYVPWTDTLAVANAGDGSVRLFQGEALKPAGRIDLGDDADNVRVDAKRRLLFVGYGRGGLAVIDPSRRAKIADLPLNAHPESFQIDHLGRRIYVNLPDSGEIAVVDGTTGKTKAEWRNRDGSANFPMALDEAAQLLLVAFRSPPRLMAFTQTGSVVDNLAVCGDADDLNVDGRRNRVYVSCGDGSITVLQRRGSSYAIVATVPTVPGARTSLFVPELDRLFVAVRASGSERPAIWAFRPTP